MRIAFVGCGFVSYLYGGTLRNHPRLELVGVYDRDPDRARQWCDRFGSRTFGSLEELLSSDAQLVVNLTNPSAHFEVTSACLRAGKHVYSEKPLATLHAAAEQLARMAQESGLFLGCAPCSLLGESAQTLWRAIRAGTIGRVHTAHIVLSMPQTHPDLAAAWVESHRGDGLAASHARLLDFPVTWPYADEFSVGPAWEHVAYPLKWLTTWFGPVTRIVNYSASRAPQKTGWDYLGGSLVNVQTSTHDLFVSCLTLADDVEVVMINSTVLSLDLRLALHGERGSLEIANQWDFGCPVWVNRTGVLMSGPRFVYPHALPSRFSRRYPRGYRVNMDFSRGVAYAAECIERGSASAHVCDPDQELHIQEITEQIASQGSCIARPRSTFRRRPTPLPLPESLGVALIGAASDVAHYAQELEGLSCCRIVGRAHRRDDPRVEHADGAPPSYERVANLFLDDRVDLIVNLAPPSARAGFSLAALRAKKHVFSVEFIASSLTEAVQLRDCANALGLRLGCGISGAVDPRVYAAFQALRAGEAGAISGVLGHVVFDHHEALDPTRTESELHAWLASLDSFARQLWLLTLTLGPVWRVRATTPGDSVSSGLDIAMRFASGTPLEVKLRPRSMGGEDALELRATDGVIRIDGGGRVECVGASKLARVAASGPSRLLPAVVEMCRSICEGRPHRNTVDHAVHQVEILHMLARSMRSGQEIASQDATVLASWSEN